MLSVNIRLKNQSLVFQKFLFLYFVIFLILKVINERSGFDLAMKAKKAKYSVSRCRILHVWLPKNAVS